MLIDGTQRRGAKFGAPNTFNPFVNIRAYSWINSYCAGIDLGNLLLPTRY